MLPQKPICRLLSRRDDIRDADAAEHIPRNGQSGNSLHGCLDPGHTVEVPERVLRTRVLPAEDPGQHRFADDTADLAQLVANSLYQVLIAPPQDLLLAGTPHESPHEEVAIRRAVGPL